MQTITILTILLVGSVSATQESVNPQAVPVGNSPVIQPSQVVSVDGSPIVQPQNVVDQSQPMHHHHQQQHYHQQIHPSVPSYYAPPAGMMQVIGNEQVGGVQNKPIVGGVRNLEQYGQPESSSIPANYKPFGSWGLYIGGNPADGYYTNYYKALSNSVDKQQVASVAPGEQASKPGQMVSQTAALSPLLKQAGSSPYGGADYYPFAYSPAELNSGSRVSIDSPAQSPVPSHYASVLSPAQVGAHVYGSHSPVSSSVYDSNVPVYADSYSYKKLGSGSFVQKEVQSPSKGYQARVGYAYSPVVAQGAQVPAPAQQQVVAYPVPVGSQMVGSQQGVDGAFQPYGIHAFTRYAVKPAVVSADQSYYYSVHSPVSHQYPAYKQQVNQPSVAYQPMSFYGYPMSQLHYSQGSIVPSGVQNVQGVVGGSNMISGQESPIQMGQSSPVHPGSQMEAASEKSESQEKPHAVEKHQQQQKKA